MRLFPALGSTDGAADPDTTIKLMTATCSARDVPEEGSPQIVVVDVWVMS